MIYLLAALLALAESAMGLGVLLPGELAITAIATQVDGTMQTVAVVLAVAAGAVLGDHLGFHLGRRGGPMLGSSRLVQRIGVDRWRRATALVRRRGTVAVAISRMLPVVRTLTPAAAGVSGLSYPRFVMASSVGSLGWATLWVSAGTAVAGVGELDALPYVVPATIVVALGLVARRVHRLAAQPSPPEPAVTATAADFVGA